MSPVTDALCGSDFLYSILPLISTPFSNDFFALSHAPPALFWNIPIKTPLTVAPAKKPPNTSGPNKNPIINGATIAMAPGNIIFLIDASVEIATHLSYCGFPVPSIIPGISRNWRRTSSTIAIAASPTARMANEEKMKGIIAPTNKPANTGAL